MVTTSPELRSEGSREGSSAMMKLISLLCYLYTAWMVFYDDPGWTAEPCYTKAAKAPNAPAPNTLRLGFVNVNGLKSKPAKRAEVALLHDNGPNNPAHDALLLCEIGNKATGEIKLDETDKQRIANDLTPFGRAWITPYVAISLSPAMSGVTVHVASAMEGRLLRMDLTWGKDELSLMVPYVPADPNERPEFIRNMAEFIPPDRQKVIGGDFNCVPDPARDSKQQHERYRNRGGSDLVTVTDAFELHDVACACSAPDAEQGWFTFIGAQKAGHQYERRLDQVYVSDDIMTKIDAQSFHTRPTGIAGVDHHLISVAMQLAPSPEADTEMVFPGMNLEVIFAGDFLEDIRDLLRSEASDELCPEDLEAQGWCDKIDEITRQVQQHFVMHSKAVRKARTAEAQATLRELESFTVAHADDATDTYFDRRRSLLRRHAAACEHETSVLHRNEDVANRAWKERCTASFKSKVQPRSQSGVFQTQRPFQVPERPEQSLEHVMGKLGDDRGWLQPRGAPRPAVDPMPRGTPPDLTDSDEIIANTELFWSCLYKRYDSHVPCQRHCLERLAECVTKVPPEVMAQLAEPLTIEEVIAAIESLKKGKVSGPNGIPAELYIELAEEWAPLLQQQFNACFATNHCLSELQRRGRISQLFKSGLRSDPANYRPVCSLNKDYQACSACQNTRFCDIAAILTGCDQTGFVAGRVMGWNILKFLDVLHYSREHNIPMAVILFDFRKAYDNVSHAFLFAIIDIMCGVPLEDVWEDLQAAQAAPPGEYAYLHSAPPTRWLQTLYSRHMRTVTVNGTTTGWFLLESSVPQGDVMASTAFILYIEALGILLRTDPNIAGVTLPSGQQMVDARFADDTGVAVTPPSIDAVMRAVEVFSAASGMVNHCIKTVGIWAGAWWRRITAWEQAAFADDLLAATGRTPRLTWLKCGSVLKLLGVMLGYDVNPRNEWKKVAAAMITILRMWSVVPISIRARVSLVKALVWSRAWFLAMYRAMPARLRDRVHGACVYYVVKGRVPKQFSIEDDGVAAPPTAISRAVLSRPTHFGGVSLWSPAVHMQAQNVKLIRDVLTPEYQNVQVVSKRFPSLVHCSWREMPLIYLDRLNWHGKIVVTGKAEEGVCSRQCKVLAGRGRSALIEGLDICDHMKRWKTLGMPDHWTAAVKDYGTLHRRSTVVSPETAEECMSMPLFGSPWVQLHDKQLLLEGRWTNFPARGVTIVGDIWNAPEHRWKTGNECWDGAAAPSPIVDASLAILHAAVPPSWHLLLKQGRTVPEMGEYVVMREHDAAHQDEAITSGLRLGLVAGRCWMGDTQDAGIWVEKLEYSELYRGFVHRDEDAVQVRWADDDWSVARAEFSPTANRGAGIFYGATHDVFSWVPRRVEWCDARSGEVICTLETYTIEAGRRILTPELNCMAPKAMETFCRVSTSSSPTLPQALEQIWQHNTWLPDTREYAWRVVTGLAHSPADELGRPYVERWQCECQHCCIDPGVAVLDDLDHQVFGCGSSAHAWLWAQQVLTTAGLQCPAGAGNFWLYGGSRDIHTERVVSVIRGAFFEALRPARRRMLEDVTAEPDILAVMIRERMLVEMSLDIFYLGDEYEQGYDARHQKAGRPASRGELLRGWRGLVKATEADSTKLIGTAPRAERGAVARWKTYGNEGPEKC